MLRTKLAFPPPAGRGFSGVDLLFDRFFGDEFDLNRPSAGCGFVPVSLWQDDNNIYLEADLPGVLEKDLEVTVHDRVLTIKAQRHDEQSRKYAYNGRNFGSLERIVALPDLIDSDQVEAKLASGILSVTLPKHAQARPKKIAVKTS
jgi:HSP20 family protein